MKALLLAAGLGTRLKPVTNNIPKCLVPINGKPLLDYWLDMLFKNGIKEVLINTHYFAEKVADHIKGSRWRDRITVVYENDLLLTGGTVINNASFFGDAPFMVAHADNLTWFDVPSFINAHETSKASLTLMAFQTDTPSSCGILEVNEHNMLINFHEKVENPPGDLANGAIYIFNKDVITFAKNLNVEKFDITDRIIPNFLGKIFVYKNEYYLRDIGTIESLKKAEQDLKSGRYRFFEK